MSSVEPQALSEQAPPLVIDEGPGGRAGSGDGARPNTLTVTELCDRIERRVKQAFPDEIWVQGAISGLTRSSNGHVYFDLVDPSDEMGSSSGAVLPVALFASTRNLVNKILRKAGGIRMHDGIEIRIRGRVAYYPPQGRVQLVMSLIDPQFTLGQMVEARTQLLEKLRAQDLLDRNRRLVLPVLPLSVALITSGASAAFADFIHEIELSGYPFRITLIDSRVQGLDAVPSLATALETADGLDIDVVVLIRGGGSRTDLVAFDHERVATAVARCRFPVIVGVGHEIDRSVADEVAFASAKTPTATAAILVDAVAEFSHRVHSASARLGALTSLHLGAAEERLRGSGGRLAAAAERVVERQRIGLDHAAHRLGREPGRRIERADQELATISARLAALDPMTALRRGWTITHTDAGELVRSSDQVAAGTRLTTTTMDGTIASEVVEIE
ncbi:MAG: exodeoxyribonuclease VII large subunit [Acidimicrobiales bacterium]